MPHRHTGSLARNSAKVVLLFALLPALLLGLALSAWYGRVEQRHARAMLRSLTDGSELALRAYLDSHRNAIATLADDPSLRENYGIAALRPRLGLLHHMYPGLVTTFGATPAGAVLIAEPERDAANRHGYWRGVNLSDRIYFQQAVRSGKTYVSGLFLSHGYGQGMVVGVASPVYGTDGKLLGVVGGILDLNRLQLDLEQLADARVALALVDPQGRVVAASGSLQLHRGEQAADSTELRRVLALQPNQIGDADPRPLWQRNGLRELLPDGWEVLALEPRQLAAQSWLVALGLLALLLVLVALAVRLLLPRVIRRLMRPVRAMAADLAHFDPSTELELPVTLRGAPYELRPIVDSLEAHAALIQALLAQREETLAEREHEIEQRTRELRRAVAALGESARTDELTGLTNYRGWREAAETIWSRAQAQRAEVGALACDIDHFKAFNDTYGHAAGDECLRRVAAALRLTLDGDARVLARSGGEEFIALFLPAQQRALQTLAEAARDAVVQMDLTHAGSSYGHVTVSIGFSIMLARPGARLDVLLRAADLALYRAKRNGRDQVAELSVSTLQRLRNEE